MRRVPCIVRLYHAFLLLYFVLAPARFGPLALGGFVALAVRNAADLRRLQRFAPLVVAAMSARVVTILLVRRDPSSEDPVTQIIGFDALALLFAGLIVQVLPAGFSSGVGRCATRPFLRSVGRHSDATYPFHQPLLLALTDVGLSASELPPILGARWPGAVLFFVIATAATAALALVSWHVWEQPFLRLKDWFAC